MPTDQELLQKAKLGDPHSFAEVLTPLEKRLYHIALGLAGNHHDAEDIWQSTVFTAWKALPKLRNPGQFKSWITRILINEAHALFRRRKSQAALFDVLLDDPDSVATHEEDYYQVHQCLSQLPREQREAVVLRFWMDFRLQEIASLTDVPLSTAKTRLYQGIEKMKTLMKEEVIPDE